MQKPEVKFEAGQLVIKAGYSVDADKDGIDSAYVGLDIKLSAAEVISEVAKKDLPWLEALLATLKV